MDKGWAEVFREMCFLKEDHVHLLGMKVLEYFTSFSWGVQALSIMGYYLKGYFYWRVVQAEVGATQGN